jgi:uncharacterized membrane protein YraQ (UPF0718 family)
MKKEKKKSGLDIALLILLTLLLAAFVLSFWKGGWQLTFLSLTKAGGLFEKIWFRLLLGFLLGGFIQVLIPRALVSKWLGTGSGLKGILIASYVSMFSTGGPFIWLPIVASLYRSGAGVGPVISLITARAILSIQMLVVWQIPFFGAELSLSRYIPCLFVAPLVGLLGRATFRIFGWSSLSPEPEKNPHPGMALERGLRKKRSDEG